MSVKNVKKQDELYIVHVTPRDGDNYARIFKSLEDMNVDFSAGEIEVGDTIYRVKVMSIGKLKHNIKFIPDSIEIATIPEMEKTNDKTTSN